MAAEERQHVEWVMKAIEYRPATVWPESSAPSRPSLASGDRQRQGAARSPRWGSCSRSSIPRTCTSSASRWSSRGPKRGEPGSCA